MDVSVGGGQENSKRDWGINGKRGNDIGGKVTLEHKNGKTAVDMVGHLRKEWGKHASCCLLLLLLLLITNSPSFSANFVERFQKIQ